ncbi:hypothetical protein JMJ99_11880 [Companilactobacillus zhachilii]|uniref:hypothetical protein n=1 Tax=Companilactobacillus zhachilii TaxID=2304606 RepID=UPI0019213CC5|nr:hypothetical protein [Companilactobacillus zhachilii]MBL3532072.1 hypothetical protein [Companilactobacillus zhachilii]
MKDMVNIIIGMIASGALGYINYSSLVSKGLISSFEDSSDKHSTIVIYSIIDLAIYLFINACISNWIKSPILNISISIASSFVVLYLFMKFLSPIIYKKLLAKTNNYRNNNELSSQSIFTPREQAFEKDCNMKVYIYDFSGNLINYGWLKGVSESILLDHEILLSPNGEKETISESELQDIMNTQSYNPSDGIEDTNIYIDLKNKIKYYIIYYSLEEV